MMARRSMDVSRVLFSMGSSSVTQKGERQWVLTRSKCNSAEIIRPWRATQIQMNLRFLIFTTAAAVCYSDQTTKHLVPQMTDLST